MKNWSVPIQTLLFAIAGLASALPAAAQEDDRAAERAGMVQEQLINRRSSSPRGSSGAPPPSLFGDASRGLMPMVSSRDLDEHLRIQNGKVLNAMRSVPRHLFVPANMQRDAYADRPLPIGYGQTISQPYIVALMTELLDPKPGAKILEVGTGSGYQAAVLTKFTPNVYTMEIVEPLQKQALPRLQKFGLGPERVINGDGYFGLEKIGPFDGIIVTAAADHIPPPLLQQLRPGARMIIPIGPVHATQRLVMVEKDAGGKVRSRSVHPVNFVPLTGGPRAPDKK
ncbi:MAG: protein-L-isoaspartate(D-aspartate) O-methyltransferase [Verrucomicrobiota bacterium]|nr:protein-L-isoaspartate(D-aspartate) O-methyltransferase [Verrucomicrobiota bacterium]